MCIFLLFGLQPQIRQSTQNSKKKNINCYKKWNYLTYHFIFSIAIIFVCFFHLKDESGQKIEIFFLYWQIYVNFRVWVIIIIIL